MTWRCALIQRRLPDYPDGDLSPFWRRLISAHVQVCPECRRELEELSEVARLYQTHPPTDPGPAFWQEFERELHVKLAQVNQSPEPQPRRLRLPHYLVGATALAGVLALAVYLGPFAPESPAPQRAHRQGESKTPDLPLRQEMKRAKKATAAAPAPPSSGASQPAAVAFPDKAEAPAVQFAKPESTPAEEAGYRLAASKLEDAKTAKEEEDLWSEDDILSWDVDSLVADLSREEQQTLKSRLESRR